MADRTANISLKYIVASQAQKEVTINEDLNLLDMLVQATAKGVLNAPPASPAEGDVYIIGDAPTGEWTGRAKHLAGFFAGVWLIVAPRAGWRVWMEEGKSLRYQGGAWVDEGAGLDGKVSKSGDTVTGTLGVMDLWVGNPNNTLFGTENDVGDAIAHNGANINISSWNGLGFYDACGRRYTGAMDLREGNWRTLGYIIAGKGFVGNINGNATSATDAEKLGGMTLAQLLAEVDRRIAAKQPG